MDKTRKAVWAAALLLLPTYTAIAPDKALANEVAESDLHEIAQSDLHDIMADRISESIVQIELLLNDQNLTEAERDQERKRKAVIIAGAAAEMQHSVDMMLTLQPKLSIDQDGALTFIALANKLKAQASELEGLARRNQFDALKPSEELMKMACNSCHALFRGY